MSCGCTDCGYCVEGCERCPTGCEFLGRYNCNLNRINRRVRLSGSLNIYKKKAAIVSQVVGQSSNPQKLLQAGGPGDLISAVQKSNGRGKLVSYNLGITKNRLSNNGRSGVDRKHDSYARYLARKTGGVLRREEMPNVKSKRASIHQPRNRTGMGVPCCRHAKNNTTAYKLSSSAYGATIGACVSSNITTCCDQRIPQITTSCLLNANDAIKWNSGNTQITGACGNNTQCVSSSQCRCCS